MAKIVITMFPEEGHLIPSFNLAHALQADGHAITYLGLPDFADYVQAQGFAFAAIELGAFGKGWRKQQVANLAKRKGIGFLREVSQAPFYAALCADVQQEQGEIARYLRESQPDLVIADGFLAPVALLAAHLGLRVALLSININLPEAENYPPVVTNIVPDDTPPSRSKARIAWRMSGMGRAVTGLLVGFNFEKALKRVMQRYGVPLERLERAALYPRLAPSAAMPELILCPQAFDFPRPGAASSGVNYIEASIDLQRPSVPFPWEKLDPERKLIFCTLGSQSHLYSKSRQFFQAVVAAVAERPAWQLVLAVGPHLDPAMLGEVPDDMVVVRWAPHTELLERAALMINHGGLGTLKECLFFGVPVLAYPITRDQPGYAARIAYHKLGLMGSMRRVAKERLQTEIATILEEPSYAEHAAALRAIFQREEAAGRGLQVINALLGGEHSAQPELAASMVGHADRAAERPMA